MPIGPTFPMIDGIWGSVIIPAKTVESGAGTTGSTANSSASANTEKTGMSELVPASKMGPMSQKYDPELAAIFSND